METKMTEEMIKMVNEITLMGLRISELESENAKLTAQVEFMGKQHVLRVLSPDAQLYENSLDANKQYQIAIKRLTAAVEKAADYLYNAEDCCPFCVVDYECGKDKECSKFGVMQLCCWREWLMGGSNV
jgi:hypothetical protein